MISVDQVSFVGSEGFRKSKSRTPLPSPQWGPFVPRPCSGATRSSFLPSPSKSPQRMRCNVGSEPMGKRDQACCKFSGCRNHCRVPPLSVLVGIHSAPRATSMRPSPSMSFKAMQTLSFLVRPSIMICFFQDGLSNQAAWVGLMATISIFPSPLTSPVVTA